MSRSPLLRPTLLPGLPRIWRGSHTLQLGLDPQRAVLLDLPDPRAARVLDLLDGTRSERAVLRAATAWEVPPEQVRTLIDTLRLAGLVLPGPTFLPASLPATTRRRLAPEAVALALTHPPHRVSADGPTGSRRPARILQRRVGARVSVAGRGRLGAPIAVALAEAGVGHVYPDLPGAVTEADLPGGPLRPADLGLPRRAAVAAAVQRAAPGTETRPMRRGTAELTVQLGYEQPVALLAAGHASRRQPHLAVALREGVAVIGPLVPAAGGPCLNCLEMHRRDRDAGWPGGLAWLGDDDPEPSTIATLLAAVAFATAEALAFLDGATPETVGAAVEIAGPGCFRRRSWPPHPGCGCFARSSHRRARTPR